MKPQRPGEIRGWEERDDALEIRFEQGRMRLAWEEEGILRVRFTPGKAFSPRRSWDPLLEREAVRPEVEVLSDRLVLRGGLFTVSVELPGGRVAFFHGTEEFATDAAPPAWRETCAAECGIPVEEGDELPPGRARLAVSLRKRLHPREGLFGFGQRTCGLDRRGNRFSHWTEDPPGPHNRAMDNLYQAHPLFMALRPGLAWGLLLHSTWFSRFDAGCSQWDELEIFTLGGELDYYLLYGPTPREFVDRLTRLTGRPALPPRWSLGYHQSRWGYGSEGEVRHLVAEFRQRGIPLDAVHLDIDHMRGYRSFTWDPQRFPQPARLLRDLRRSGVRAVTIVDPGIKVEFGKGYGVAEEMATTGMALENPDGSPWTGYCWPDAVMFPDFTRAEVREWWGCRVQALGELGVSGVWNDMNEPSVFQRPFSTGMGDGQRPMPLGLRHGGAEESAPHAEVHNLYGTLMSQAAYEGLLRAGPEVRPWVLTRSAFIGIQRYAASWMGDNTSWWEHLQMSLPQLASMGLCGSPHVGVDIGGFFGHCTPELFARWIQLGAFYPFMRNHTARGTAPQEPWAFGPEVEEIARRAIRLRYRLLPYLYTLAVEAHRTGAPILRPLLYEFPEDVEGWRVDDQAMVGPSLLVAPVVHPGRTYRLVYLPEGCWYDFWTGQRHQGPAALVVQAPLWRIPVFIRGGGALPLGPERHSTAEPLGELTWDVYPAGETSSWTLVEDDGETFAYRLGAVAETEISCREDPQRVVVRLGERRGSWAPAPRKLSFRIHCTRRPVQVLLDRRELSTWSWDADRGAASLSVGEDDGAPRLLELALK